MENTNEAAQETPGAEPAVANAFAPLTPREREVALGLAIGMKSREIAGQLDVSVKTVDTHRLHVLKKLNCRNAVELARLAIREGLVQA